MVVIDGLWVPLFLGWMSDLPGLFLLLAWSWVIQAEQHWPLGGWVYLLTLGIALVGEAGLAGLLPRVPLARSSERVGLESAVLFWSVLHWGTILGLGLWQFGLGFDAASRVRGTLADFVRRLILRGIRLVLGVSIVIILGR